MGKENVYPILLSGTQVKQGAELLARAFQNAPDMKYFLGDEDRMFDKSTLRFYAAIIRTGILYGAVHTMPSMEGLAVWVGPENTNFTLSALFRSGLLGSILFMGLKPLARFVRSAIYLEKLKEKSISGPHWILVQLGVEPTLQGNGIGGRLIQPILAQADEDYLNCYVESADERNLNFYRRHGFKVADKGRVPNGGPQVWAMVREPGLP
jgi:ribosomal protein S18 acetylase RimI-like enzyme